MGKRIFVTGLILLAIFIVHSFLTVICGMNENNPSAEWRKIGYDYCDYAEGVLDFLRGSSEFIQRFSSKK